MKSKLNGFLEIFLWLVIIRHIIALFTVIPQIGMIISGYGSLSIIIWNIVLHITMIVILLNLLKVKKWALYLFGGVQLINIISQTLFFGKDLWELTIVATILCAIMAALLCLRKDGISAWQLFFPKKEQTQKDELDIEFEMLQEEDVPNYKNISTEIPEDEINISEITNDEVEDLTIDTLPQKEDGSLDYEKMTPIQQFAYTCKTESVEVALKDLNADIKALEKSIGKVKKELSSLSGGNRAKLRDSLREEQMKLNELYNLRNKYVVKKKSNWMFILVLIGIVICLICFIYLLFYQKDKTSSVKSIDKSEILNNTDINLVNKPKRQFIETKKKLHTSLVEEGYTDIGTLSEFMEYIDKVENRQKLFECLKKEDYDNFTSQLELDSYLGYESVFLTYLTEGTEYNIPISFADEFENNNPSAYIKFVNKGKIEVISISEKNDIKFKDKEVRPHLTIKFPINYMESKRRLLFYSLLATGYLSKAEIGTMPEFIKALNNKKKLKEFYLNLLNWGFLSSEIGSESVFCNNLSKDFSTIINETIKNKKNNISARDRVYNKLKSLGLTDSKEDFLKYYDSDENVRKDVYKRLRKDGLTDTEDEFYEYMKP